MHSLWSQPLPEGYSLLPLTLIPAHTYLAGLLRRPKQNTSSHLYMDSIMADYFLIGIVILIHLLCVRSLLHQHSILVITIRLLNNYSDDLVFNLLLSQFALISNEDYWENAKHTG